ncbi:protein MRG2-like isoform X2 [Durio zibethinus]|uniref:Protein MRG2-like isoform X2 n=1 Tax=Durio zibethinus TaxID=66656 RepID=A0A6P6AUX7_DURZI|nr:protein MRG2-like isoform X2 [Durio zibethinus]
MGSSYTALNDDDDSATESDDNTATKIDSDSDSETETDEEIRNRYDTGPFREGERVLAYHSKCIYEAKVLNCEKRSNGWHYYVHYRGWNKNWDEWVGVDTLMKFIDENLQKQEALNKKLKEEMKAEFHSSKRGTVRVFHSKPRNPRGGRGKKRKNDSISKEKSAVPSEKLVNIQIPLTLKKQLVDDSEFITHLGKLVKLPRTPNVEDILKMYLDYRCKKDGMVTDSVREIFNGIRAYFNKALPVMLLYKSERQQYEYTITEDIRPSTVYGAEHLLRLFVKLPELLVRADIEEDTLLELQQKLVAFLKCELYYFRFSWFLQKNQNALFLSTYHVAEDVETSTNKQDN